MGKNVKYFHSDLPGAPVLSGTAGSLIAVLDACLVNGWGLLTAQSAAVASGVCTLNFSTSHAFEPLVVAQVSGAGAAAVNGDHRVTSTTANSISFPVTGVPDGPVSGTIAAKVAPAGWVKAFSGTNRAAYKSAAADATGCVMRIDDRGAQGARLRAYESMTDIDTGVGPTPTDLQVNGGLWLLKSDSANSNARKWIVRADERGVVLLTAYHSYYTNDYQPHYFGDFESIKPGDAYKALVVGSTSETYSTYAGSGPLSASDSSSGAYAVRSYSQIGGAVPITLRKPGLMAGESGNTQNPPGPNPVNNSIDVVPTVVYEGTGASAPRRGSLPAVYGIPHFLGSGFDTRVQIQGVVDLVGHVLIGVRFSSASTSNGYRYAIDVTGPAD